MNSLQLLRSSSANNHKYQLLFTNRSPLMVAIKSAQPPSCSSCRSIVTTVPLYGRRNFRKFPIANKRGVFEHAKLPKELMENEYAEARVSVDDFRIRYPGVWFGKKFTYVREMEPELIVPADLEQCELKPYVSYRTEDIVQSEFTPEQLFTATYGQEIVRKHREKKPYPTELTGEPDMKAAEKAKHAALKTGADLFSHTSFFGSFGRPWRWGHGHDNYKRRR